MRIRTLFLLSMSVLATMTGGLGCWLLFGAVTQYRLTGRIEQTLQIDSLLLTVAEKLPLERPSTTDALFDTAAASETTHARIAAARAELDDVLPQVTSQLAKLSTPGIDEQLKILRHLATEVSVWRQQADAAIELPADQRKPGTLTDYLNSFKPLQAALDRALDSGDVTAMQQDGMVLDLLELARRAWQTRVLVASRSTPMLVAITHATALTAPQIDQIVGVQAMLNLNWRLIDSITRRLSALPGVAATVTSARATFDRYEDAHIAAFIAGRKAEAYPVSAVEYGKNGIARSAAVLAIRDAALSFGWQRAAKIRHDAALGVAAAVAVVQLSMLVTAVVLALLIQRIVVPIVAMTQVIGRIAKLEFEVTIPARKRMDEIGQMAVALEALRRGAIAGEENNAHMVHMARHDALTGLANRVTLNDTLEQAVAMAGRGQNAAALCLDLDRFKAVNDTFGHPTGDRLLQAVAERLQACVRDVDMVSRLGGDEFVVVLVGIDGPEQAAVAAHRIAQALSEPFNLDGPVVSIGCSVGIAITPQDATEAVALLKCADTALYRAKSEEKGSWRFFKPEMDRHLQERMEMERDLRAAVQDEAFELVYQPQYTLAREHHANDPPASGRHETDHLSGFEALLRWRHPVRGLIGPATFIAIAEETGLIVPIGAWVLRQACAEATQWPASVRLAVNVSAVQLKNLELAQTVRQVLASSGLAADRLELEITEIVLLRNDAAVLAMLHEMHDMGIQITMDDFGTGYSSLSYLRSFPFDTIKIDKSFIRDLSDHEASRAIIRAVVALGNSLGMTTTAEGVETAAQLTELRREGCTKAQGHFFSRPLPAAAAGLLADNRLPAAATAD